MPAEYDIVVIGAGHAGVALVQHLRANGFSGSIALVGDEPHAPYQRPPLTKDLLLGDSNLEDISLGLDPEARAVTFMPSCRVVEIERQSRFVRLADGAKLGYGKLVLATGSRPRRLPGAEDANPLYLTCLADCLALKERLPSIERIVVIGGGFIGLEAAAALRKLGKTVTVVEAQARLLARAGTVTLSDYLHRLHTRHGVDIRLSAQVDHLSKSGVTLKDGTFLPADAIIIGIGALPNDDLARQAGLDCDNGILVDELARTSDPHILAAGDCTCHPNMYTSVSPFRLESVQNAGDQAVTAAETLLGREKPYRVLPTFWSDQYDARIAIAGVSLGADETAVRGDPAGDSFSVFCWRQGRLVAVESVNRPKDQRVARQIILAKGITPEQVRDEKLDLKKAIPA